MAETPVSTRLQDLARSSVEAILANQSPSGAIVASPDFEEYRFCWLRDGSFCAYALDVAGETEAAGRYHRWVESAVEDIRETFEEAIARRLDGAETEPSAMPPARFTLEGNVAVDEWPNFQIDGYGTWLWSLGRHLSRSGLGDFSSTLRDVVALVARYLEVFATSPCYDVWEESGSAVHTSTLAGVYAGLTSAAELLRAPELLSTASSVKAIIRSGAERCGYFNKSSESDDVDASTLWLSTPFQVADHRDATLTNTVRLIRERLTLDGGLRRYSTDTYFGGGAWPVLSGSLGWHYALSGQLEQARECLEWVASHVDSSGRLAEQFGGETRDPQNYEKWVRIWGVPARDLMWSHAMYVILAHAVAENTVRDRSALEASGIGPLVEGDGETP